MPCGHGRVLRFLAARYPGAALVASDLDAGGVAFCSERFGAQAVLSTPDLADVELPGPFDLIWCGSLVTHLDAEANAALLDLFRRSLAPAGVAVVTTHGELVAERLRAGETYQLDPGAARAVLRDYDSHGFGYADYPWSPGYGVSVSSRDWIAGTAGSAGLRVAHFAEHAWCSPDPLAAGQCRAATERTGGRRVAAVDQLAPASPEPNRSPEVAPKYSSSASPSPTQSKASRRIVR
jgi:SAM-dependent methyltransferase